MITPDNVLVLDAFTDKINYLQHSLSLAVIWKSKILVHRTKSFIAGLQRMSKAKNTSDFIT